MTAAAVLTTGLLAGSGSSNAGAGTIPAETTISGTTVEAQTAGEDAGTEGKKQLTVRVQTVDVKGLKQLARLYVWVIRGTPLLVKLYVIFMGFRDWG